MNIDNKLKREPVHIVSAIHPKGGYVARPGQTIKHTMPLRTREGGYIAWPTGSARQNSNSAMKISKCA